MRLCIAVLIGIQGCGVAHRPAQDFSRDSLARKIAEQRVYNAAAAAIIVSNRPAVVFVVKNRFLWSGDSTGPAMAQPAWRDFVHRSRESGVVPVLNGDLAGTQGLLGVSSGEGILSGDVTDTAVIAFSGMGFSPSGDEAVVLMDYRCGTRCGVVAFGWFRRQGEGWVLYRADTTSRRY